MIHFGPAAATSTAEIITCGAAKSCPSAAAAISQCTPARFVPRLLLTRCTDKDGLADTARVVLPGADHAVGPLSETTVRSGGGGGGLVTATFFPENHVALWAELATLPRPVGEAKETEIYSVRYDFNYVRARHIIFEVKWNYT